MIRRTTAAVGRLAAVAIVAASGLAVMSGAAYADETPAGVAFSNTCSGIHAVFTSADQHVTEFDVTTPDGDMQTITGSGVGDFAADAAHSDLSVAYDGTSAGWTWADPGDCGSAVPSVSASKDCVTGITVVLGDLNGTSDATFRVTGVDGTTETVVVRAGAFQKLSYPVTEDTIGVVTVKTDGLSKAVTYAKDCSTVKGVKVEKPPNGGETTGSGTETGTGSTTTGGDTEAAPTLPMTGYRTEPAALLGLSFVAFGALLVRAGSMRRRKA